jgi:hypothetical protein
LGDIVTGVPDPGYATFPVSYDQLSPAFYFLLSIVRLLWVVSVSRYGLRDLLSPAFVSVSVSTAVPAFTTTTSRGRSDQTRPDQAGGELHANEPDFASSQSTVEVRVCTDNASRYIFYRYGSRIRKHSRFATSQM